MDFDYSFDFALVAGRIDDFSCMHCPDLIGYSPYRRLYRTTWHQTEEPLAAWLENLVAAPSGCSVFEASRSESWMRAMILNSA